MSFNELKAFLDEKAALYNHPRFIETDPIRIPHRYTAKEDIAVAAFLTAIIAWGNRKSIIANAGKMMQLLGNSPYDFVMNHREAQLEQFRHFVHRTFNGTDLGYFVKGLKHIYRTYGSMEALFALHAGANDLQQSISAFKKAFFEPPHPQRTVKHISDPAKGSAAKRINMFLRWMVRKDKTGVDFGIWQSLSPAQLSCPLDVHSGNVARKLGLLQRRQNDAKALAELDGNLRKLDPEDPVKYDYALFGLGVFEKF
ncbi:MAG: TIGR02757 family protein [Sinomicrobium sp.]|nr:TIGR02757 family protein [Sinomicrobium sp.]